MTGEADSPRFSPSALPYRWAVLAGVWLLYLCFGLTAAAMAPLVKPITEELGLSHSVMGAILGAWPLIYIASAIPCGILLDHIGVRRALFLAAMIIGLSGALRGLADSDLGLFLAVGVFGLGGPLISVGAPKMIVLWFEGKERGLAMGIYITGPALGGIIALSLTNGVMMPLTGGDWRMVLMSYAGFVLSCGLVWLAICAHGTARAVEQQTIAERKQPHLQVFAALLRLPAVRVVLLMSIGIFFFNHGLNNWLPEILRSGGMSAAAAGYWASIPTAVGIVGALLIPRLAVPSRRLAILLGLFLCSGLATLLLHSPTGPLLAGGLVLQGIARGSMMTIAVLLMMETRGVAPESMGLAGGLFFSTAEIGGVLGPLSVGFLSDLTGGFAAALYLMSAVCAGLVLLLVRLRRLEA
ncbi:MAG: MFS transporter [Kiloniellales bacterium]